jgi:hypothetical protein
MTMDRDGARWRVVAHDARGAPLFVCTLVERQASCAAAMTAGSEPLTRGR